MHSHSNYLSKAFPGGSAGKELPAKETRVRSLGGKDHLEKKVATHSRLLPGKFLVQKSLAGYSQWGYKEPTQTQLSCEISLSLSLSHTHTHAHTKHFARYLGSKGEQISLWSLPSLGQD